MAAPGWSARQGLAAAASVVLSLLLAAFLGLDGMWWAAISAWVVANPDFHALWRKAAMRMAGTAAGLVLGYGAAIALEGQPVFEALALFIACAVGCYRRFASSYGYAWFYATITFLLMLTVSITQTDALFAFAQFRFLEISCGVVASALVHAALRASAPGPRTVAGPPASAPPPESDFGLMHIAMVGGFAAVAMMALWAFTDLPSLPQAIASALVVLDRDMGTVRVRARQRVLGCVIGGAVGLAALLVQYDSLIVYGAVVFAGTFYFSRLHNGGGPQSYVGTQGGLAFITALVTDGGPPMAIEPVVGRLAGILIGVALMLAISSVLAVLTRRGRAASTPG